MNVVELFNQAAAQYPDRNAIIEKEGGITYFELANQVQRTAAYFRKKGIGKGDRVLVFVPMSIDLYRIVLALFSCGATAVFLDEWVSKKRMELCCEIADCKGFIGVFKARVFALFSKELRRIPVKLSMRNMETNGIQPLQMQKEDAALITFTTGSTGRPKAANRTHGFLSAQFDALLDEIEPRVEDVDMPVLPIVLFMNLGVGCTSVIADFKMTKPEQMKVGFVLNQIRSNHVTRITASPYFISRLSDYMITEGLELNEVQKIFTGGAPVFPQAANKYKQAFPNSQVNVVYGSTEVEPISSIEAGELLLRSDQMNIGLPVGKVFHKTALKVIRITDEPLSELNEIELNELTLAEGEIGEIIASGEHVLQNYFNSEEAFKKNKIRVGDVVWHRTGDSGKFIGDELFLTGRAKQLIQHGQEIISPFIIENQLIELEGVEIGTIIKIGDQLLLIVETKLSKEALLSRISSIPFDEVVLVDRIPRDPRHNSKIDYEALKQMVA